MGLQRHQGMKVPPLQVIEKGLKIEEAGADGNVLVVLAVVVMEVQLPQPGLECRQPIGPVVAGKGHDMADIEAEPCRRPVEGGEKGPVAGRIFFVGIFKHDRNVLRRRPVDEFGPERDGKGEPFFREESAFLSDQMGMADNGSWFEDVEQLKGPPQTLPGMPAPVGIAAAGIERQKGGMQGAPQLFFFESVGQSGENRFPGICQNPAFQAYFRLQAIACKQIDKSGLQLGKGGIDKTVGNGLAVFDHLRGHAEDGPGSGLRASGRAFRRGDTLTVEFFRLVDQHDGDIVADFVQQPATSQMSPFSSSARWTGPLHFGQARISRSSLLIIDGSPRGIS